LKKKYIAENQRDTLFFILGDEKKRCFFAYFCSSAAKNE